MTANTGIHSATDPNRFLHEQLGAASPGLLRTMLGSFIEALMSAEADTVCGTVRTSSPERTDSRNGYRHRDSTPAPAPWMWRSRSSAPDRTSRTGWSAANAPRQPSPAWWLPATCLGLDPADGEAGRVPWHHEVRTTGGSETLRIEPGTRGSGADTPMLCG